MRLRCIVESGAISLDNHRHRMRERMPNKEATSLIKIDKFFGAGSSRFIVDRDGSVDVLLEPAVPHEPADFEPLAKNYEKVTHRVVIPPKDNLHYFCDLARGNSNVGIYNAKRSATGVVPSLEKAR